MNAKEIIRKLRISKCYPLDAPTPTTTARRRYEMNDDIALIEFVITDYSLRRRRGCLTDEETQERAERALSWLVKEVKSLQTQLAESQRREMEVDDIADFIIQNENSIRIAMDTQDRRYLENIIISWRRGSEDGE